MLGRRWTSLLLWRRCPWGKWHWRWGYCRCINADTEITRRTWKDDELQAARSSEAPQRSDPGRL
jgi:hypothetical protein